MPPTLSKSDFKLARTCVTKLYYKELGLPQTTDTNRYLEMLAKGGYMVEQVAKAMFPEGVAVEYDRKDPVASYTRTAALLQEDTVTLFEATLLSGRKLARVDILRKRGNRFELIEVKSVSFDSEEAKSFPAGPFRGKKKPYRISAEYAPYLEDVAFQVHVLRELHPDAEIVPYLMLVDQARRTTIEGLPGMFHIHELPDDDWEVEFIGDAELVRKDDLLARVDVSEEVALLMPEVEAAAAHFVTLLTDTGPIKEQRVIDWTCKGCEFRASSTDPRDGYRECWGKLAESTPHLFELYKLGSTNFGDRRLADVLIENGRTSLLEVPPEHLVKKDGTPTAASRRQIIQIDHTRSNTPWIGATLGSALAALQYPLHFIDFETSLLALPYHRGMRGYEKVAFQWSCHSIAVPGGALAHRDWLNTKDSWPNAEFARTLRDAIGDTGSVLTWSHYEGSVLKEIRGQLDRYGAADPELDAWLEDVIERRIVDLHKVCVAEFFHPAMGGRTSIKVVLDALWKADPVMRQRYAEWTGSPASASEGPYDALPAINIDGRELEVFEGTGAMQAYTAMLYGVEKDRPEIRAAWETLLRRYCTLDTLAMVLIWDYWVRVTR